MLLIVDSPMLLFKTPRKTFRPSRPDVFRLATVGGHPSRHRNGGHLFRTRTANGTVPLALGAATGLLSETRCCSVPNT